MGIEDRRAREFQRRETDILTAAQGLAKTEHWSAVTIDLIAEKAEIGKGTVYKHFKSKDEVAARLVMEHAQLLLEKLRGVDPTLDYVPRVKTALKVTWQHFREAPELSAVGMYCDMSAEALVLGEDVGRAFWGMKEQVMAFWAALLEEGIARGILADQPRPYLMVAGWATMVGTKRLVLEMDHYPELADNPEFLDYLVDFVLKGMVNAQAPGRLA